jgi:hypothetical protein
MLAFTIGSLPALTAVAISAELLSEVPEVREVIVTLIKNNLSSGIVGLSVKSLYDPEKSDFAFQLEISVKEMSAAALAVNTGSVSL